MPGSRTPLRREWPLGLVLLVLVTGVVLVWQEWLRPGTLLIGGAALLGALLRLLLPESRAGMLAVRRRGIDVAVLAVLGAATVALTLSLRPLR